MSLRLRAAIRDLLASAELHGVIEEGSPFAHLRELVHLDEVSDSTPIVPNGAAVQIAALTDALLAFRKPGGHFVGCASDKDGKLCAAACRRAQLALDPGQAHHVTAEIGRLLEAIRGLEADRTSLRQRLRHDREYFQRVLRRARAETGFEVRPPGRPRTRPVLTEATTMSAK